MPKRYKQLIFDLDGTILDTDLYVVMNYAHMFRLFRPDYIPRLAEMVYFSGPPLEEVFAEYFPGIPPERLLTEFRLYSEQNSNLYITEYEGERECLDYLQSQGYILSLCTSKRREATVANLTHFDLLRYFDHLVTVDDVRKPKPDPEGLLKCVRLAKTRPEEVLYIGDSDTDLLAGHNAGIATAYVSWGLKTRRTELEPRYVFSSFASLKEAL